MGAFNTVRIGVRCPKCGYDVPVDVQFKYGNTWQLEYSVGDELRWGGNQIGDPEIAHVVVDSAGHVACARCGFNADEDFYVFVRANKISAVERADGRFNFGAAEQTFLELQ
jgi:hypothetical protein